MSKSKKSFFQSQKAHKHWEQENDKRYQNSNYKEEVFQLRKLYHGAVLVRQEKANYILNSDERTKVYNSVVSNFY